MFERKRFLEPAWAGIAKKKKTLVAGMTRGLGGLQICKNWQETYMGSITAAPRKRGAPDPVALRAIPATVPNWATVHEETSCTRRVQDGEA